MSRAGCPRLALVSAAAWLCAAAWAEGGGVFEADGVVEAYGGEQAEGALPLRVTRMDFGRLAAARDAVLRGGDARLTLNLFADSELTAIVERAASTPRGYALSGRIEGEAESAVTLVANGDLVLGTVWTPQATYQLRTAGAAQVVERDVRPAGPAGIRRALDGQPREFCLGVVDAGSDERATQSAGAARPAQTADSGPPAKARAEGDGGERREDDGSVIDVLVLYTPQARRESGGHRSTLAKIDHNVAWTNDAYARSGVVHRIRLVAAVEATGYQEATLDDDVDRLADPNDGHLDEAHELSDAYSADEVLMQISGNWGLAGGVAVAGLGGESLTRTGRVFAHELGHVLGLHHERQDPDFYITNRPFPYSYGYRLTVTCPGSDYYCVNFGTIMARGGRLPRFSNSAHFHEGHRLGVPGDEPTAALDGPADAARHLNELRRQHASRRQSADACRYRLSSADAEIAAAGGMYALQVAAPAGCAWRARAADDFVEVVAGASGSGDGRVEYRVAANAGWGREAALAVAGEMHVAWQPGGRAIKPVCERTAAARDAIAAAAGRECGEVSARDLATVAKLALDALPAPGDLDGLSGLGQLEATGSGELAAGTFDGLGNLIELRLRPGHVAAGAGTFDGLRNLRLLWARFSELRPGAFRDLSRVDIMWIGYGSLRTLEPGVFDGVNSALQLDLSRNDLRSLPVGTFRGLSGLQSLSLTGNQLAELRPGVFDDVPNLVNFVLGDNDLAHLEPGVFRGLAGLFNLSLAQNAFSTLEPGLFAGLDSLYRLWLGNYRPGYPAARSETKNDFRALPPGAFDGVRVGHRLDLQHVGSDILRPGLFRGLRTGTLDLRNNGLASVGPDAFEGLSVGTLDLSDNQLRSLDGQAFRGMVRLGKLDVSNNRLETLDAGMFDEYSRMWGLDLSNNRVERLPEGAVPSCIRSLRLQGNRLAALPKGIFRGHHEVHDLCGGTYERYRRKFVTLNDNPGAPFAAVAHPVRLHDSVSVRFDDGAPFSMSVELSVAGVAGRAAVRQGSRYGSSYRSDYLDPLDSLTDEPFVASVVGLPEVSAPVACHSYTVVEWDRMHQALRHSVPYCYTGLRLVAGPPVVLNAIRDRSLAIGDTPERVDLADAFLALALEELAYAARSSNPSVVAAVDGATLTVAALEAGTATITVTATTADGRTATRTFSVVADELHPLLRGWRLRLLVDDGGRADDVAGKDDADGERRLECHSDNGTVRRCALPKSGG